MHHDRPLPDDLGRTATPGRRPSSTATTSTRSTAPRSTSTRPRCRRCARWRRHNERVREGVGGGDRRRRAARRLRLRRPQRGARQRGRGRRGDVPRRRRARHGPVASSPFGSGSAVARATATPELVMAGARAHNRWLADFCAEEPERRCRRGRRADPPRHRRRRGRDPRRRRRRAAGRDDPDPLGDASPPTTIPVYEPVWAAAEDLGMVLHTPLRRRARPTTTSARASCRSTPPRRGGGRPVRSGCCSGPACSSAIPSLQVRRSPRTAPGGCPTSSRKMDEKWVGGHNTRKFGNVFREKLSHASRASTSTATCFLGRVHAEPVEDIGRRDEIGVGNMLWGNDFPHPEGTFPHTRESVRQRFHDVPEDETRRMLGLNAAEVYGIDAAALAGAGRAHRPTVDEVHSDAPLRRRSNERDVEPTPRVERIERSARRPASTGRPATLPSGCPMPREPERCSTRDARVRVTRGRPTASRSRSRTAGSSCAERASSQPGEVRAAPLLRPRPRAVPRRGRRRRTYSTPTARTSAPTSPSAARSRASAFAARSTAGRSTATGALRRDPLRRRRAHPGQGARCGPTRRSSATG